MAYIYLDELKKILPDIFNDWMDGGDESWEWIFQEIEQKCHVGKRKKDKKQKKHKKDDVSTLKNDISVLSDRSRELNKKVDEVIPKIMEDFDARINAQTKRIDGLSNKVSNLSDKYITVSNDIKAAKFMAQTAKQRTEVDYTKCSKEKSDADVVQEVYNRMSGRGATFEELENFRNVIKKYDALEKKEIPVNKKVCCITCAYFNGIMKFDTPPCNTCNNNNKWEEKETCETCKYNGSFSPCDECNHNDKWEAKDNG